MKLTKRELIGAGGLAGLGIVVSACSAGSDALTPQKTISALKPLTENVPTITAGDHAARIAKAQKLMRTAGIKALVLEAGASLQYFTGIRWWRSERLTAAVIPAEGEIGVVTPHFEEPSIRESMKVGKDVRVWNEHESPFARLAGILKDRNITGGKIAFEDTVRFFAVDGLQKTAPQYEIVSGGKIV